MKYSKEQIQAIQQRRKNIQREISISNKRNKAIQEVIVDGLMDESLLDGRNHGDIENDLFARKALLNDYSNELIKDNSYEFQQKIMDEGYDEFFLNNFPKIKNEARMYRVPNSANMFDLVKKLYNISQRELNLLDEKTDIKSYESQMLGALSDIKFNLENLGKLKSISTQQRQEYNDALLRISALLQVVQMVDTKVEVMKQLFGSDANVLQALEDLKQTTQLPSSPNQPLPPLSQAVQNITQQGLQQAMPTTPQQQTPTPPTQTPVQTPPQSPKSSKKKSGSDNGSDDGIPTFYSKSTKKMTDDDKSDELLMQFGSDILQFEQDDFDMLEQLAEQYNVNRRTFANYLSKLTDGLYNANQLGFNKSKSKDEMLEYFLKRKQTIINHVSLKRNSEMNIKTMISQNEELERKRLEEDRQKAREIEAERQRRKRLEIDDYRNQIQAINQVLTNVTDVLRKHPDFGTTPNEDILKDMNTRAEFGRILTETRKIGLFKKIFTGIDGRSSGIELFAKMRRSLQDERNIIQRQLNERRNNP